MTKRFRYTEDHIKFLRIGYQSMPIHTLTKAFNEEFGLCKTEGQIKAALKNHRIRCGRKHKDRIIRRLRLYTEDQAQFIKDNYAGRSVAEMTALFNKTFTTAMTKQQIKTFVHNRGITSGHTGQFERGHKPWNYGTKGQGLTGANRTSFKKGNEPANRRPLWDERVCPKDGYIQMKVPEPDPYTGFPTRYKNKHVWVWEQENGPVPPGMVVAFRDGGQTNCEPDNLMLLSRAELLRLNQAGYKDAPDELKPSILALVKLEVKTFGKEKGVEA